MTDLSRMDPIKSHDSTIVFKKAKVLFGPWRINPKIGAFIQNTCLIAINMCAKVEHCRCVERLADHEVESRYALCVEMPPITLIFMWRFCQGVGAEAQEQLTGRQTQEAGVTDWVMALVPVGETDTGSSHDGHVVIKHCQVRRSPSETASHCQPLTQRE
mmetsp:Transcript_1539/g.2821  ORF Transcript_1539/g.2821 Transcript_1539/m.2821 type:complete len:159 (+) Transcript_1539:581-1057(+)